MGGVSGPDRPATQRGAALGESGRDVMAEQPSDDGGGGAVGERVEIGAHLGAEVPAEGAGIGEQREVEECGDRPRLSAHDSATASRRARAVASCAASRPASAAATARPRLVNR